MTRGRGTGFLAWGLAAFGLVLVALLVRALQATDGTLVYALDDPAIHLSIAGNLLADGTWGVVPGEFQSASSSPLWTLLVAGYELVSPLPDSTGPLVLNLLAVVFLLAVLGRVQRLLVPAVSRPLDVLAVALLVAVPLFLPALVLVGMEHVLHMALVVLAVALFVRRGSPRWPRWLPYVVLGLAMTVRLETGFVAAGIGLALLVDGRRPLGDRVRTVGLVAVAAGVPLAAISLWTRANGQGWLPNSVLAKVAAYTPAEDRGPLGAAYLRLTEDPLVAVLALVAVAVATARGERWRSHRFVAVVVLVTIGLHVALARMGWYERYQAYLIALGVALALAVLGELVGDRSTESRGGAIAVVVAGSLLLCQPKLDLTWDVPDAVADTYGQRYQAGLFLDRYYDGEPIATGELGYISLLHDGPLTDLLGLGDREVLEERLATDDRPSAAYWESLAEDRGFRVVAMYPRTTFLDTPASWILVGTWRITRPVVTAFEAEFQFWATTPAEVEPLMEHLTEFAPELPDETVLEVNDLALLRADQLREQAEASG